MSEKEKDLGVTNMAQVGDDVVVYGDPGKWVCVCKASSKKQGWMKSTKALEVTGGCIIQTTTQQRNPDGSYALCDALVFVPGLILKSLIGE